VTDPAEHAAGANPHARRNDEPENARQNAAVVDLSDSGNDKAENAGESRIAHAFENLRQGYTRGIENLFRIAKPSEAAGLEDRSGGKLKLDDEL